MMFLGVPSEIVKLIYNKEKLCIFSFFNWQILFWGKDKLIQMNWQINKHKVTFNL